MSAWDPAQYQRFATERRQPFTDLLGLVERRPGLRAIDLGCGTGELTIELHHTLQAAETTGLDNSTSMLNRATAVPGVHFDEGNIDQASGDFDLVFSNAALQWLPHHLTLFPHLLSMLRPGGQIAVQMPANYDHESHAIAHELSKVSPYREALGGYERPVHVLSPEVYAGLLFEHGCERQHVRLQVYGHVLDSTSEVLEWVKGTLLVPFRERLPADLYEQFLADYLQRLLDRLGDRRPFFYPFKRLLLWGTR